MSSSVDWTTPEAYLGRTIPTPARRSLPSALVLRLRIWVRAQWRERQRMMEFKELCRLGYHLPENVRRDIGLPPYDHP